MTDDATRPRPHLSIVIPAYNEENRLPGTLRKLAAHLEGYPDTYEVLAVVEKSGDATVAVAGEAVRDFPGFEVIDNQVQRGKGYAIRCGVLRARGEIVLVMDADLSVPAVHIDEFLAHFREHPEVDLLVANRQHPESVIEVHQSAFREFLGRTFNTLVRVLAGTRLKDTQCGFKAFRRAAAEAIFERQTIDGFACDVEVLILAKELGFARADLPVHWINSTESKVRIPQDCFLMLWDVLKGRWSIRAHLRENPYRPPAPGPP